MGSVTFAVNHQKTNKQTKKQCSEPVLFCLHLSTGQQRECSSVPAGSFPNDLPLTAKVDKKQGKASLEVRCFMYI